MLLADPKLTRSWIAGSERPLFRALWHSRRCSLTAAKRQHRRTAHRHRHRLSATSAQNRRTSHTCLAPIPTVHRLFLPIVGNRGRTTTRQTIPSCRLHTTGMPKTTGRSGLINARRSPGISPAQRRKSFSRRPASGASTKTPYVRPQCKNPIGT
jgi:hypothetical protein